MRKVAIFVEGHTELIFVREFLLRIFDYQNISLECYNLFTDYNFHETDYSFSNIEHHEAVFYFQIINVGNDNAVLSRILKREKYMWNSGFHTIIGLRDMYGKSYREEAKNAQIYEELNQLFKEGTQEQIDKLAIQPNKIHFLFAIMEVEAWFLGFEDIFEQIDEKLTAEYINEKLGFNLRNINPETAFFHPADTLNDIYALANLAYKKKSKEINSLVSKIEKDDYALLDMSDKCASFSEFYDIILKQKNEFDS